MFALEQEFLIKLNLLLLQHLNVFFLEIFAGMVRLLIFHVPYQVFARLHGIGESAVADLPGGEQWEQVFLLDVF